MNLEMLLFIIKILSVIIIIFGICTYPKWSRKEWYKRCEINSKHPDWKPHCNINFIEKDTQWFIDNGYEKYVDKKRK